MNAGPAFASVMRTRPALFAVLALCALALIPNPAHANTKPSWEQHDRDGFAFGFRMLSGAHLHGPQGFMPTSRFSYTLGAAINRQFVLGADLGVTAWWDHKKASLHGDTFGKLFVVRGLFIRGAAGVASHTYVARDRRAGVGGSLGAGWEFPLRKKGVMSLSAEYDARIRSDRFPVRTVLFGLTVGGYSKK